MKLIASDLDGTLLNSKGKVSAENAKKIKEATERGIIFVAVTGRPYESAYRLLDEVGITCPIICLNGANTYTKQGQLIRTASLTPEMIEKIKSQCEDNTIHLVYFTEKDAIAINEATFINDLAETFTQSKPRLSMETARVAAKQFMNKELVHFLEEDVIHFTEKIYKVLAFSKQPEKLRQLYRSLENVQGLAISSSDKANLEFNHINAEKGIALQHFAKQNDISMEDVMAIGDNLNDVSMLRLAGRPVAMGNAIKNVQDICLFQTKTNDEHGVALAIDDLLNEMK